MVAYSWRMMTELGGRLVGFCRLGVLWVDTDCSWMWLQTEQLAVVRVRVQKEVRKNGVKIQHVIKQRIYLTWDGGWIGRMTGRQATENKGVWNGYQTGSGSEADQAVNWRTEEIKGWGIQWVWERKRGEPARRQQGKDLFNTKIIRFSWH